MIFLLMVRWPEQVALEHTPHILAARYHVLLSTADVRIMMIECLLT